MIDPVSRSGGTRRRTRWAFSALPTCLSERRDQEALGLQDVLKVSCCCWAAPCCPHGHRPVGGLRKMLERWIPFQWDLCSELPSFELFNKDLVW